MNLIVILVGAYLLVGIILSLLAIILLLFHHEKHIPLRVGVPRTKKQPFSYREDMSEAMLILQECQLLIGPEATRRNPSLADISQLIGKMQREFGREASLEGVIQMLAGMELHRQCQQRKNQRTTTAQAAMKIEVAS